MPQEQVQKQETWRNNWACPFGVCVKEFCHNLTIRNYFLPISVQLLLACPQTFCHSFLRTSESTK